MIPKINPQTAQAVLEYALAEGLLSEEQITLAISKAPTAEMMRIASLIHQVSCHSLHETLESFPEATTCDYYNEEQDEVPTYLLWQKPEHLRWLKKTITIMQLLEIQTEEEFHKIFQTTRNFLNILNTWQESHIEAYALLLILKGWEEYPPC